MPRKNSRDPESDPAAAFGDALRRLREAAGITTQGAAGKRQRYSVQTISRWETGASVPGEKQLTALLDDYVVTDLLRDVIIGMWLLACKARGPIPEPVEMWVQNEAKAAFLRLWGLLLIPAQLQTRDYARALFLAHGMNDEEADEYTEILIGRQAIQDGSNAAHLTAVLHERALYNLVGSAEVMIGELEHILERSWRRNVHVLVVRDFGCFVGTDGAFEIASGDEIPDTLLTLEAAEDHASDDPARTRKTMAMFEEIRTFALNAEDSRALISEAIEFWKSKLK